MSGQLIREEIEELARIIVHAEDAQARAAAFLLLLDEIETAAIVKKHDADALKPAP